MKSMRETYRHTTPRQTRSNGTVGAEHHPTAALEVNGLTKRYRSNEVLRGVSFTVWRGELFGLLGTNGAGKTTTVEIVQGAAEVTWDAAHGAVSLEIAGHLDPVFAAERYTTLVRAATIPFLAEASGTDR